jgi:hypothetical protein
MKRGERLLLGLAAISCAAAAITGSWSSAGASETVTYTYDARGRLVRVEIKGSVNNGVTTNYAYDKADNRTLVDVTGAPK